MAETNSQWTNLEEHQKITLYDWQINSLTACAILGRQPSWAKIIEVGLKSYYSDLFNRGETEKSMIIFNKYPNLAPDVRNDKLWWGINPMVIGKTTNLVMEQWIKEDPDNYKLIGKWKLIGSKTRFDRHLSTVLGKYKYLTNETNCICNAQTNDPIHWVNHCPTVDHLRSILLNTLNIETSELIHSYLTSPYSHPYYDLLEEIYQTHILPRMIKYQTTKSKKRSLPHPPAIKKKKTSNTPKLNSAT